jgi:hypothetical protein
MASICNPSQTDIIGSKSFLARMSFSPISFEGNQDWSELNILHFMGSENSGVTAMHAGGSRFEMK